MTAKIIDGKTLAQKIRAELKETVQHFVKKAHFVPGLAVILIGEDPASQVYVKNKRRACAACGIRSVAYDLPLSTSQTQLLELIAQLNTDPTIHGILVQLPLPKSIDTALILEKIDPKKDVDGFHPLNLGLLAQGRPFLRPCTPYGVIRLLAQEGIALRGLEAVVVGTSTIVGKPMALELLNVKSTVTLCHSATRSLAEAIQRADLLVSAMGQPGVIQSAWIKKGAIVIDVGITRSAQGALQGDIEFATAQQRAAYLTPVPGGVGPMTVTMLLENTLLAAQHSAGLTSSG